MWSENTHCSYRNDLYSVQYDLNNLWDKHNLQAVNQSLLQVFEQSTCIYSDCLELLECSKYKKKPKSLGNYILERFDTYQRSAIKQLPPVSNEIKERALELASVSHTKLFLGLVRCFSLDKPSLALIKDHIKELCGPKRNLNAAMSLTTSMNMQDDFTIFDMALPAYLQNKLSLLEPYMHGSEKAQTEMMQLLDNWLDSDFDIISFCSERGLLNAKGDVLRPQFQDKVLTRWLKLYGREGIATDLCPNLCKRHAVGALRYVLYRYYMEDAATYENTQELIKKTVGEDVWLQNQLIDILKYTYNDYAVAEQWEIHYNTYKTPAPVVYDSDEDWGAIDNNAATTSNDYSSPKQSFSSQVEEQFHTLKLSEDSILIVDDHKSLQHCKNVVLENNNLVGIDAEWSFSAGGLSGNQCVALLQLAVKDRVFLVDVFQLVRSTNVQLMTEFLNDLFTSKSHIKIGFGLREDLHKLVHTLPGLQDVAKNPTRILDLHVISKHVCRLYPRILEAPDASQALKIRQLSGLSKLVQQTLGFGLDKKEQISDWERRPLRQSQIQYAALDAYCLLEVYDVLGARLKDAGSSHTLENIVHQPAQKSRAVGRGRGVALKGRFTDVKPGQARTNPKILACEFHVVCDNMLQGLGRHLRCCGVDALILSNFDDHDVAAKLAQKDDRVILTSGAPFFTLSSQVAIGRCFNVPNDLKAKDQVAVVLEHFAVKVTPLDLFSRCQLCNSGKYLKVPSSDMLSLIKNQTSDRKVESIPWDIFRDDNLKQKTPKIHYNPERDCEDEEDDLLFMIDDCDITKMAEATVSERISTSTTSSVNVALDINAESSIESNKLHTPSASLRMKPTQTISPNSISQHSKLNVDDAILVTDNGTEKLETPLLYSQVPLAVCVQVNEFYCCIKCGKIYWEGKHFGNVVDKFEHILSL